MLELNSFLQNSGLSLILHTYFYVLILFRLGLTRLFANQDWFKAI